MIQYGAAHFWVRKDAIKMIWRRKSKSPERREQPYSTDELAEATAAGLGQFFARQNEAGKPAGHEGLLDIILRGKEMKLDLNRLVDESDRSPVLIMAGVLLAKEGVSVDISLVVKNRHPVTGTVTETGVVVTPKAVMPPDERNVLYPPNPDEQWPSVPFRRLAERSATPLGSLVISADAGDQVRAQTLGL